MSNLEKTYKLILNVLDCHPRITVNQNYETGKYEISRIELDYGGWELMLEIGMLPNILIGHLYSKVTDQDYLITNPDEIDILLNGLKGSYMHWVFEGIDD